MNSRVVKGALIAALSALVFCACGKSGGDKKSGADATRPPLAVETAALAPESVTEGIDITGTLKPKYDAIIKSEYQGIIRKVFVTEWVRVKKGDPLAELDTREGAVQVAGVDAQVEVARAQAESVKAQVSTAGAQLEAAKAQEATAKAQLEAAKAGFDRAKREHERLLGLKEAGLVTRQALDDAATALEVATSQVTAAQAQARAAHAQVEAASAGVEAAKAQVASALAGVSAQKKSLDYAETRFSKLIIRAPIDGVVASRGVSPGDLVGDPGAARVMFHIVDNRTLDLTVSVPTNRTVDLALGQTITFTSDAFPGKTYTGTVRYINPVVNEADRSVNVSADVNNPTEKLKGGLFVTGRIITVTRKGVLLAPSLAFVSLDVDKGEGVLLTAENSVAKKRVVPIGKFYGDRVEIAAGLAPGSIIITRGGYRVKDGDRVQVMAQAGER